MGIIKNEEARMLLNIRKFKIKLNKALKILRKQGIDAYHSKKSYDDISHAFDALDEKYGKNILANENYAVCNKVREGKYTTPYVVNLFWCCDKDVVANVLDSVDIEFKYPKSKNYTFILYTGV